MKRKRNEDNESGTGQEKKLKTPANLKRPLPGIVYQLKMLMLFLKRGLDKKYKFKLGTELSAAEKLDDVVFQYTERSEVDYPQVACRSKETKKQKQKIWRFMQVKHKDCDNNEKITVNHLLKDGDAKSGTEFSLQKYFTSYRKIKHRYKLKDTVMYMYICTNIDIEESLKSSFDPAEGEDHILRFNDGRSERLQLKVEKFFESKLLFSKLRKSSEFHRLAKELAKCVYKGKPLNLKNKIFQRYHGVLGKKVIDIKSTKFRDIFLNGSSQKLDKFRSAFLEAYQEISETEMDWSIWKEIKETELRISGTFGTGKDLKSVFPDDYISEDEIKSFFNNLVFAVNQPNEKELGKIIEIEMGKHKDINLINSDLIASQFQNYMLDWMKEKKERFLTHKDGKTFFEEVKQQISKLALIGLRLEYEAKCKDFGIEFRENLEVLQRFLSSNDRQIFNLICSHTILGSLKVYQTVKYIRKYKSYDSYIFISISSAFHLIDCLKKAFKSKETNLLIMECKNSDGTIETINTLNTLITDIVRSNGNKKIILITELNNELAMKLKNGHKYEEIKNESNGLRDLDDDSQQKLLKEGKVIFQGKTENLGKLIDKKTINIVDAEILHKLINKEKIVVGSKVPQISDSGSQAYSILTPEDVKIERFTAEDDLFVISGIGEEELTNRGIAKEKICLFDLNNKNTKQYSLLNSKFPDENIENFEKVCHKNPSKMIHFIEFIDNKFMWKRYYDPKFYTDRDFYRIEIDIHDFRKHVSEGDNKSDIFIVINKKEDFQHNCTINNREKIAEFQHSCAIDNRVKIACSKENNLYESQIIILDEENEFNDLSDELKDFNVHLLEKESSEKTKLFWKRSKGETSEIRRLIINEPADFFSHNSLLDNGEDRKSIVIADMSGTGKSTILTVLSESYKNENILNWVIRVNLRDYSSEIGELSDEYNFEKVVAFYSVIDKKGFKDKFAKDLFEHRLRNESNILLLFDGFDEIGSGQNEGLTNQSADKQNQISSLLKFLKDKTKARIVVTTRPYEKQKTRLENTLSVLSYTFKPIKNERKAFLKKFWKKSLKLKYSKNGIEESKCETFAKDLIDKFDIAVKDEKSRFMGIPLHLRMLAEVHLKDFKNFHDDQKHDFKDLKISNLYKEFVDRKYKIYFSEKTGLSSTGVTSADSEILTEQYEKIHKRLAFKYLFSGSTEPFKLFFSAESEESPFIKNKMPTEENTRELKRIGITQSRSDDGIDFIHRTFAEYFVSKLIYDRLKQKLENPNYSPESKDEMRKFLLNHIFVEEYNVIRSFINSEFELFDKAATLKKIFWPDKFDPLENKKQLLLAVKEGLFNIFTFLLPNEKDQIYKELISEPRRHIAKLCDVGNYIEADLLTENATNFLIRELGDDNLEVAIMKRYLGNYYGALAENTNDGKKNECFKNRKEWLEKALDIFKKHREAIEVENDKQRDYFLQALWTYKENFECVKGQGADKEKETWIRVLEIEIANVKRNLANALGDLGYLNDKRVLLEKEVIPIFEDYLENPNLKAEEKLFTNMKVDYAKAIRNLGNVYGELGKGLEDDEEDDYFMIKKDCLVKALDIFKECHNIEECNLEVKIAKTQRNLGNVLGKLGYNEDKKENLEQALPVLKKHYGLLNSIVTKAQLNLSKAYIQLGDPLHGAVISGDEYKLKGKLKYANISQADLDTLLILAVREGQPDIVKLLIITGANPICKDKERKTPLDLAKHNSDHNNQIYEKIENILNENINNKDC